MKTLCVSCVNVPWGLIHMVWNETHRKQKPCRSRDVYSTSVKLRRWMWHRQKRTRESNVVQERIYVDDRNSQKMDTQQSWCPLHSHSAPFKWWPDGKRQNTVALLVTHLSCTVGNGLLPDMFASAEVEKYMIKLVLTRHYGLKARDWWKDLDLLC